MLVCQLVGTRCFLWVALESALQPNKNLFIALSEKKKKKKKKPPTKLPPQLGSVCKEEDKSVERGMAQRL